MDDASRCAYQQTIQKLKPYCLTDAVWRAFLESITTTLLAIKEVASRDPDIDAEEHGYRIVIFALKLWTTDRIKTLAVSFARCHLTEWPLNTVIGVWASLLHLLFAYGCEHIDHDEGGVWLSCFAPPGVEELTCKLSGLDE